MADHGLTLTIQVRDSKLQPTEWMERAITGYLSLFDERHPVQVIYRKPKLDRSTRQNAYYWGVVLKIIAEESGNNANDLHEIFKEQFLPQRFVKLGGKEIPLRKSTAELSAAEFQVYLTQLCAWAGSELGLTFPEGQ